MDGSIAARILMGDHQLVLSTEENVLPESLVGYIE